MELILGIMYLKKEIYSIIMALKWPCGKGVSFWENLIDGGLKIDVQNRLPY
jgi:hypothetical protein